MHWLDPDYLPVTTGKLQRFLLNPHGDVDGLLLADGTEIHTPPHLSHELLRKLNMGEVVAVHGVKPRHADVIVAVAIDTASDERIADRGPPHDEPPHHKHPPRKGAPTKESDHHGTIQQLLHGPKGNVHGALLQDGAIVRFPPHCADELKPLLAGNAPLQVRGHVLKTPHGTVIEAQALGNGETMVHVHPKPKPHAPKPKHKVAAE
jgi:hypothetical protein